MKQRAVPPQMVHQIGTRPPVALQLVEPRDAVGVTPFHLHHMGDRVRPPDVAGINFDRGAARGFGYGVIPTLLVREAMARQDRAVAGKITAPLRLHALDRGTHRAGPSKPEIAAMREAEREHVERMLSRCPLPDADRAIEISGN